MFSYHKYIYHGLRKHLLSRLDELYSFQLTARAELSLRHTLHVHSITVLTFTPPIHPTLVRFFLLHPCCHYPVCMPWFTSHDLPVPLSTNTSYSVEDRHSQTFPPSRLNNYSNMYGGTIVRY